MNDKKLEYWNYFITNKKLWVKHTTIYKLKRFKEQLFENKNLWDNLLLKYGGNNKTPEEMKKDDACFNQAFSYLAIEIYYIINGLK
jgi:hypothetical protein